MGCKREGQGGWHRRFCRREGTNPRSTEGYFCLGSFLLRSSLLFPRYPLFPQFSTLPLSPLQARLVLRGLFPPFVLFFSLVFHFSLFPETLPKPAKRSSGILLVFLSRNKPSKEVKKGLHFSLCKPFNMKYTNCNALYFIG